MRTLLAVAAVAATVSLGNTPAHAIVCPPGTRYTYVDTVAGRPVYACLPVVYCDPGPCTTSIALALR